MVVDKQKEVEGQSMLIQPLTFDLILIEWDPVD